MQTGWTRAVLVGAVLWALLPGVGARVSGQLSARQQAALARLEAESLRPPQVRVQEGVVRFLSVDLASQAEPGETPRAAADAFLERSADLLDLGDPAQDLVFVRSSADPEGNHYVRYAQTHRGLSVIGSDLIVTLGSDLRVESLSAGYAPHPEVTTEPSLSAERAFLSAAVEADRTGRKVSDARLLSSTLSIYDPAVFGEPSSGPQLVWSLVISAGGDVSTYAVQAQSGKTLAVFPEMGFVRERRVWDAGGREPLELPQAAAAGDLDLLMDENGPALEHGQTANGIGRAAQAERVWALLGAVYDGFWSAFRRDSYDGAGAPLNAYLNVRAGCPNAAWSRELKAFLFCDEITAGLDVAAHEFSHAVIDASAGLISTGGVASQSGALAESYADVLAAWIDPLHPWVISWDADGKCVIRDLADPNHTPVCSPYTHRSTLTKYPASTAQMTKPGQGLCTHIELAAGCAHLNSTIPSQAVYLLSEGGGTGVRVRGIGREKAAQITYRALVFRLTKNATFLDARDATRAACQSLTGRFEITGEDCAQVDPAFATVGVREAPSRGPE